jgi:hypothetical protein
MQNSYKVILTQIFQIRDIVAQNRNRGYVQSNNGSYSGSEFFLSIYNTASFIVMFHWSFKCS